MMLHRCTKEKMVDLIFYVLLMANGQEGLFIPNNKKNNTSFSLSESWDSQIPRSLEVLLWAIPYWYVNSDPEKATQGGK